MDHVAEADDGDHQRRGTGDEHAQDGHELHEKGQHAQQHGVRHLQHSQAGADQYADEHGEQQDATNVAADHAVDDHDQQLSAVAGRAMRRLGLEPLSDAVPFAHR